MPVQPLDIILVSIMFFSGLLAMLRGLTREMLSIMSWALSALVTLLAFTNFRLLVEGWFEQRTVADALLIVSVFIVSLIVFSLLTANVSERVLDSRVGAIDRTLGFLYGVVRGLILVVIAYLIVGQIVDRQTLPKWITQARSLYLIEYTGDTIKSFMPDNPDWLFKQRERPSAPAG